jgi:CHAD domain-containing protein
VQTAYCYRARVAYAFERDEQIPAAITRMMREQITRTRDQLTDATAPPEKRVHDARKRFKETRALLRMVRKPLGVQFAIENVWFRDAGRELAAVRDADAVLEALEKLELSRWVRGRVKRELEKNRTHAPLDGLIANTLNQLLVAEQRIASWPAIEDSFQSIADGLRKTYRDGRRSMNNARSAEELHEWRKQVKTHWYHAQLLRNIWPQFMKPYAGTLEDLSHALGDHHDLHVLAESIGRRSPSLLKAVAARQEELEQEAEHLGKRIYAERPDAWLARMRNYWSSWRDR